MIQRISKLSNSNSFFIFGARGTGKSTLISERYGGDRNLYIDLLQDHHERRYRGNPDLLLGDVESKKYDWVIIDEIQKVPKLLDLVHKLIVSKKQKFVLTGSSSRKLKRDGANLLAGRAFLFQLFPFTVGELAGRFNLQEALAWGTLPAIFSYEKAEDKKNYLYTYAKVYLREEILLEQVIRNVEGFRGFLEIAAQMNGKTLNFSKIARECGVDSKTVRSYYQILEDTLMGFMLPGFHRSVRKAQKDQPKFYLFDLGLLRSLEGSLDSKPVEGTSMYGQYFESLVINEIYRLNAYSQKDYRLSHYQTTMGQEIDLILSRGSKFTLVEIKSTRQVDSVEVTKLAKLAKAFPGSQVYYLSQDPTSSKINNVYCLHWQKFLAEFFAS